MMKNTKDLEQKYLSVPEKGGSSALDEDALFVMQRYNAMAIAKQEIRNIWAGTQALYYANDWEWIVGGEDFSKPIRFPTLRDVIKSLTDIFVKDPPDWLLSAMHPEEEMLVIGKKAKLDEWRNSIHEKAVRRQIVEDMFFFGKAFRSISYYDIKKNYGEETKTLFNDIATRRHDPRDIFVDESCMKLHDKLRIDGARDVIIRDKVPLSTFQELGKRYGFDTDGVVPENYFTSRGLDYLPTNQRELIEKAPVQVVRMYEYMNQEEDLYMCVAGNKTVYRDSLKKAKGTTRFPLVDYTFEPRNDSYWGTNLAQLLAPHIYLKDTILNLEIMNLKLTLQPVVAVSGEFGFNKKIHQIQPGGVWQASGAMNGKIQDNITPLTFGNANTRSYEMLQNINSELTVTARTDIRSLEYYKGKTATEVLSQRQSMNAHNETVENITEVESECILAELANEILTAHVVAENENGDKKRVKIEGYIVTKNDTNQPQFVEKSGYKDIFELTQEMIDVDVEVNIQDKRSQMAQDIEKMGRIMQAVPMIANVAQLDPESLKKIDFVGIIKQIVEAVGLDVEQSFKSEDNEYDDMFELAKEEIMLGNKVPVPQDESRKDSISRLKFLLNLKKKLGDDMKRDVAIAYQDHLAQTTANITRSHVENKPTPEQEAQMMQMAQAAQQAQGGGMQNVPQANPGVMGLAPEQTMNPAAGNAQATNISNQLQ